MACEQQRLAAVFLMAQSSGSHPFPSAGLAAKTDKNNARPLAGRFCRNYFA
ncbi:hypothetical protein AAGQ96_01840 [Pantoea sp. MBD-2R]|uniref:hypothetical protein n=1 Tax=unclassified Pantoea TaxID=2630326 RepID=UPI00143DCDE9|nr:hypothetical protein [Pantoea sp. CCBC3-3-1]